MATQRCPCGYMGDAHHPCACTPQQVQRYRSKVSGPLLDRIDLHIEVPAVPYKDLRATGEGSTSAQMREHILTARERQAARFKGTKLLTNADLSGRSLERHCPLGQAEHDFLERAVTRLGLSARAFTRILRIARTIADIEGAEGLDTGHLAEAINYRSLDRVG